MSRRPFAHEATSRSITIFVALLLAFPAVASAQMPVPILSLGERDWSPDNTCANAPGACSGETWDLDLGLHEFVLARVPWMDPTDIVEVRLHWPAAWSFLGWESCAGTLVSGDPSSPGSTLRFTFEGCPEDQTFLRVWMDCPVPGTFRAEPRLLRTCWGYDTDEYMGLYVDIGDWCGAAPHGHCDLCQYLDAAGSFQPGSVDLTLLPNEVWSDTLGVFGHTGPYCPGLPECCPPYGAGFGGLSAEPAWIHVDLFGYPPDQGWQQIWYRAEIDAGELGPGVHAGKIWAHGGCCTRSNCIPVTIHVLDPAEVHEISAGTGVLGAPWPNPASGAIRYDIRLSRPGRVRVSVVDAGGRQVAVILDRDLRAGVAIQEWQPSEEFRARLASGIYFLRCESAAGREARAFVIRR